MVLARTEANLIEFPATGALTCKLMAARYSIPQSEHARYRHILGFTAGDMARASASSRAASFLHGSQLPATANRGYLNIILDKPQIVWTANLSNGNRKEPCEDPRAASRYEAGLARLPRALSLAARITDARQGDWSVSGKLELAIEVNSQVLASRALARLVISRTIGRNVASRDAVVTSAVQFSYCPPDKPAFGSLYDCLSDCKSLVGIDLTVPITKVSVDTAFPVPGMRLREDQAEAVEWLVAREMHPEPFPETETDEELDLALGIRVSSKAVYKNDGTRFNARGGVAAHEIGFGKTVVTLGLVRHQVEYDKKQSVNDRKAVDSHWPGYLVKEVPILRDPDIQTPLKDDEFFFHTSTTLIVVPAPIMRQWANEIRKFLGNGFSTIVVKNPDELRRYGLAKLRKTDILITSFSFFSGEKYEKKILQAAWSGDGQPPGCERERGDLYRHALNRIRLAVAAYNRRAKLQGDNFNPAAAEKEVGKLLKSLREGDKNDQDYVLSGYAPRGKRKASDGQNVGGSKKRSKGANGRYIIRDSEEDTDQEEGSNTHAKAPSSGLDAA